MNFINPTELAQALANAHPPLLIDVRRVKALSQSGQHIPGAVWLDPALWLDWKDDIAQRSPLVLYCAHGQEVSQALTTALHVMGAKVSCLEGGFSAWERDGHTTAPLPAA
jgi:thiosulfate sulfurtransferase